MKRKLLVGVALLASSTAMAQDAEIVNRYGQPTGYRVQGSPTMASPSEMAQLADYLSRNKQEASITGGLSSAMEAGFSGYERGQRIALHKLELKLKEQQLEEMKLAAKRETVPIRKDLADAWIRISEELLNRVESNYKAMCAKNPKDEICDEESMALLPDVVVEFILRNQVILVSKPYKTRDSLKP